jgi:hypothetical protein
MRARQQYNPKELILKAFGKEPETLDEIAQSVIATVNSQKDRNGKQIKLSGFSWNISYRSSVRNSHDAPVGYPKKWSSFDKGPNGEELPNGYPGFEGRVWIRYADRFDTFARNLSGTLTYPGTGGGGAYDGPWQNIETAWWQKYGYNMDKTATYPRPELYSWDYRFFTYDWPKVAELVSAHFEEYDKECVFARLQGKREWELPKNPGLHHKFLWEDAEMKAADDAFIATNPITKNRR